MACNAESSELPAELKSLNDVKILGAEQLAPIVQRKVCTIKVDAHRRPDSLPPRLRIPQSTKLLWLESDVLRWLNDCRDSQQKSNK
jgi:hypothetical protein